MTDLDTHDFNQVQLHLLDFLERRDRAAFRELFLDLHERDQSEFYVALDDTNRQLLYEMLTPHEVGQFYDTINIDDIDHEDE